MDITTKQIEIFIKQFYVKVNQDALLSPIFNEVAEVSLDEHIPKLIKFWSSILLKTGEYQGNAYRKHVMLAKQVQIENLHFQRWLALFEEQARLHFEKNIAEDVISKASNIANSLKIGMLKESL